MGHRLDMCGDRANRKGIFDFSYILEHLQFEIIFKYTDKKVPGLQPWIAVNLTVILQALVRGRDLRGSSRAGGLPRWQIKGGSLAASQDGQPL